MPHKFYLYARRGIRGWCWIDSSHRRANNTILALKDVGLPTLKDEMALVCSVGTGPWKGGAHFGKYSEAMAEYTNNFTWRDDLFQFLYNRITCDLNFGVRPPGWATEEHMRSTFETMRESNIFADIGRAVKLNRWFHFTQQFRLIQAMTSQLLLALVYIGLHLGWWAHVDDSPLRSGHVHEPDDADDGDGDDGNPRDHGPCVATLATQGRGVAGSSAATDKKLNKRSSLKLACRALADRSTVGLMAFVASAVKPTEEEHSKTVVAHKTEMGTSEWFVGMATGARYGYIDETVDVLYDCALLHYMGMGSLTSSIPECTISAEKARDAVITIVSFLRELMGQELCSCMCTIAGCLHASLGCSATPRPNGARRWLSAATVGRQLPSSRLLMTLAERTRKR
jgi:hypothetical protein